MEFLDDLFTLLDSDGVIVISVPTMVGIPFLLQRMALKLFGLEREQISRRGLFNAVVRRNTDALEPAWESHAHLGFNHKKLERFLIGKFAVLNHRNLIFSQVYVIGRSRVSVTPQPA